MAILSLLILPDKVSTSVRPSHFSSQFAGLENWGRPLRSELVEGVASINISTIRQAHGSMRTDFKYHRAEAIGSFYRLGSPHV